MEQIYIISEVEGGKVGEVTKRGIFFRFGEWCYAGVMDLGFTKINLYDLRLLMPSLQRQQGQLRSACEFDNLPIDSPHKAIIDKFREAAQFVINEVIASEDILSKMAAADDQDWSGSYFELKTNGPQFKNVELITGKVYVHSVMLHVIYFNETYYAIMSDASGDQPLLDTHFPDVTSRTKEFSLEKYTHDIYKQLSICLSTASKSDAKESLADNDEGTALEAVRKAEEARSGGKSKAGVHGAGAYNQIYVILQPPNPDITTSIREVMFRFGNWCYHGSADLGFPQIGLSQLPIVMPRLHQQQHRLQSTCEYAEMPKESKFRKFLHHFADIAVFLEDEIVAAEEKLIKMASDEESSWIDEDFTNVFFELTIDPAVKEPYEGVEMIASKTYTRSVVLHIMYYKRTYYVVINDASSEQPLLDTYFPDVSRRDEKKKIQIKDYPKNPLFDRLTLCSGRTLHFKVKKDTSTNKVVAKEVIEEGKERSEKLEETKVSVPESEVEKDAGDSKVDKRDDQEDPSRKKEALERMKGLNFVRAPHHIAPIKMDKKLDSEEKPDPFAKKKLGGIESTDKPDPFAKKKVLGSLGK